MDTISILKFGVPNSLSEWQRRSKLRAWKLENYKKLTDSRSTRVIVLAPGSAADYVQSSLRRISLDDSDAKFEALSYTWGSRAPPPFRPFFSIWVDGHRFDVTYNLHYASRNLRDPVQEKVVWIDAVCINQADVEERAQQVKLMGHIFSKAEQVVIYLGIGEIQRHVRTAISFVRRAWQQKDPEEWLLKTLGSPEFAQDWISASSLLAGKYWSRIWIIQEIGLAKQPKVCCLAGIVEWDALCLVHRVWRRFTDSMATTTNRDLIDWYIDVQSHWVHLSNSDFLLSISPNPLYTLHNLDRKMNGPWRLEETIRARQRLGEPIKLLDLLAFSYTSFSTNPRDKIYGLLGLANDHGNGDYKVDYLTFPTWVPYWGPVAITNLLDLGQLNVVISSSFWRKVPLRFPGQRRLQSFSPVRHRGLESFLGRLTIDKNFAAAGSTDSEAQIEEIKGRNPVLVAAGCVVDEIAEILNPPGLSKRKKFTNILTGARSPGEATKSDTTTNDFAEYDDFLATPSTWLSNELDIVFSNRLKRMLARFLNASSPLTGDSKLLAFLQAITYDSTQSEEPAGTTYWAPFQVLIRNGKQKPAATASSSPDEQLSEDELQHSRDFVQDSLHRVHEVLEIPVGKLCRTRRRLLYVTKQGIIGLGEPHAKEGDLVCVIKGCFRPILVKRKWKGKADGEQDEKEQTVTGVLHGCTFLHGYMEGRAIEEMKKGLLEACTFRLE